MKKHDIFSLLPALAAPLLTIFMGLVLLLIPDTATALFCKLLGWLFLLGAVSGLFFIRSGSKRPVLMTILMGLIGLWILMNPLALAKSLLRVIGLTFFIWGAGRIRQNYRGSITPAIAAAGAVAILGAVLFLVPMTATRLVLNIAGIVIICMGASDGMKRLRGKKRIDDSDDPNIIDVEKL